MNKLKKVWGLSIRPSRRRFFFILLGKPGRNLVFGKFTVFFFTIIKDNVCNFLFFRLFSRYIFQPCFCQFWPSLAWKGKLDELTDCANVCMAQCCRLPLCGAVCLIIYGLCCNSLRARACCLFFA